MAVGITLFIVAVLVIGIYLLVEVKRLRHKMFAIFLIVLILFTYISFVDLYLFYVQEEEVFLMSEEFNFVENL